mmetsp:Transcript_20818/g.35580  ORF Transcript_20818/g.35580 Transcript_20818/m.35580 type:complete len:149 (+) Transcript_20818:100-546(+)|eukprot:CAMPEP_0119111216 /NCGR_PEP_ID=MMETSP1180-20130426/34569_1 /TAXON_ID=3052 ORGANISM="Chlamydomonas cf sp, Strain CCMP681" /NCGR_SAMPLE_ID=MMETSP1180 /ASSEMBLY_ACC=CAM_ASM_000741 /LENGTH=148 /DNA_ID=CAMNT_0007098055 /DNA_START=87 /DNA_END=533 /DNA_ORIENTATION=-
MVYAGYVPAKMPTVATELDRALAAVTNESSLEIIGKLCYNAACSPKEDKFRRIKLTNKNVQAAIVEVPGAVECLLALGWVREESAEDDALVLPAGVYMTMAHHRLIEAQKHTARKENLVAQADKVRRGQQAAAAASAAAAAALAAGSA